MIEVYKMGMSKYKDGVDKNSGLYEFDIIKQEVSGFETDKNVLIILNGVRDSEDEQLFEKIKKADVTIFIMSDSIALKTSLDIINSCDYCLHQGLNYKFNEITCEQTYSYLPELFYKHIRAEYLKKPVDMYLKFNKVLFGGNNLNRQDKFDAYQLEDPDNTLVSSLLKIYGDETVDNRIEYTKYLDVLAHYRYSLVICRDEYRNTNWLTSRFFESVAVDCLPIIDEDYDKQCQITSKIKVDDIYGMKLYMDIMNISNNRERTLEMYHARIIDRQNIFAATIWYIINRNK